MIEVVRMEGSTCMRPPQRFEAGVPMTAQVIGLAAAVEYLQQLGMDRVQAHEEALTGHALEKLAEIPGVTVIGPPDTVARRQEEHTSELQSRQYLVRRPLLEQHKNHAHL